MAVTICSRRLIQHMLGQDGKRLLDEALPGKIWKAVGHRIFGFCYPIHSTLAGMQVGFLVVTWDIPWLSWRHLALSTYKCVTFRQAGIHSYGWNEADGVRL